MAIDYSDIGQRIKQKRMEKGLTQEKLAELVGIGPSHMSHLESGKTVASMDVFIAICNVLECSSDELLCREIVAAKPMLDCWLTDLVADCDAVETKILTDILLSAKNTLRKNKVCE
jgi:transcriptional regulator with XRE-family HTH domain